MTERTREREKGHAMIGRDQITPVVGSFLEKKKKPPSHLSSHTHSLSLGNEPANEDPSKKKRKKERKKKKRKERRKRKKKRKKEK